MITFDQSWIDQVCAECDPVFAAADVGFVRQLVGDADGGTTALLWEADPPRFADRYPDSGIIETYGPDQWPGVHCIDYWVHLESDRDRVRLEFEGWNLPALSLDVSGRAARDGAEIADTVARILGVPSPRT